MFPESFPCTGSVDEGKMGTIACLDVHYESTSAFAAGLVFREWSDAIAFEEKVVAVKSVEPYHPGEFFRRELPCLLAVLERLPRPDIVIVDGYVWLDGRDKPGLGARLYEALERKAIVIGVAKTEFRAAAGICEVKRGTSSRPLYVSATGMQPEHAADLVRSMHGPFRIPTLLARVDQLARSMKATD
jgi:deoxyribonuclease V